MSRRDREPRCWFVYRELSVRGRSSGVLSLNLSLESMQVNLGATFISLSLFVHLTGSAMSDYIFQLKG